MSRDDQLKYATMADEPVSRLLKKMSGYDSHRRAETRAMQARNYKIKWIASWKGILGLAERQREALKSPWLKRAFIEYANAYTEDLNHYYSGINALSLVTIMISLVEGNLVAWNDDSQDGDGVDELKKLKTHQNELTESIKISLFAAKKRQDNSCQKDFGLAISEADLACIIEVRPGKVASLYRNCLVDMQSFHRDSIHRQLLIYKNLDMLTANVNAALGEFNLENNEVGLSTQILLFTGLTIDRSGPLDAEKLGIIENEIVAAIDNIINRIRRSTSDIIIGMAGAACGGEILFHETCKKNNIDSRLLLALPRDLFVAEYVAEGGRHWIERFDGIYNVLERDTLMEKKEIPDWLRKKRQYNLKERNSCWIIQKALVNGSHSVTLLALSARHNDQVLGNNPYFVTQAIDRGINPISIEIKI